MKKQTKRIAVCGVMAALGVVILLLGNLLGIGLYLAPMLVGLCLIPIGREWGIKYQLLLWIVISLLALLLVPDLEETVIFLGLLGWYPALRPQLQKIPSGVRIVVKLLLFNAIVLALEFLLRLLLAPEAGSVGLAIALLLLGNAAFLLYDFALPRIETLFQSYFKRLFR